MLAVKFATSINNMAIREKTLPSHVKHIMQEIYIYINIYIYIEREREREAGGCEEIQLHMLIKEYLKRYKSIGPVVLLIVILHCLWWKPISC